MLMTGQFADCSALLSVSSVPTSPLLTPLLTGPRRQVGADDYRDARFQDVRADETSASDNHR